MLYSLSAVPMETTPEQIAAIVETFPPKFRKLIKLFFIYCDEIRGNQRGPFNYAGTDISQLGLKDAMKGIKAAAKEVFQQADVDRLIGKLVHYIKVLFSADDSRNKTLTKDQELKEVGCDFIKFMETLLKNQ